MMTERASVFTALVLKDNKQNQPLRAGSMMSQLFSLKLYFVMLTRIAN